MASVKYSQVPIKEKNLYTPPLEEVAEVLSSGLSSTFANVEVSVVDCPDLTKPPFYLTSPGISGSSKLVEVGGVPFLLPLVNRDKVYDLAEMMKHLKRDPGFLIGAGAGPWPYIGVNCEGMVNLSVRNRTVNQGTRVASVEPIGARKGQSGYLLQRLPDNETRSALLGNYLLSSGNTGKVIKVVAKKRVGESNFITAIREILKNHYGDNIVGLGGAFLLRNGRAKFHVMPEFSTTPLCSDSDVDNWLHYFEMKAPMNVVGTLISGDPGLDLRVQHFHGWGEHGDGGHYHYDTTPDIVEYEGYFAVAESIIRVDAPEETHHVGRD